MIGNVNVPGALAADIANKVDKIAGKGLSTEDYTTAEKIKLANIDLSNLPGANNLDLTLSQKKIQPPFSGAFNPDVNIVKNQINSQYTNSSYPLFGYGYAGKSDIIYAKNKYWYVFYNKIYSSTDLKNWSYTYSPNYAFDDSFGENTNICYINNRFYLKINVYNGNYTAHHNYYTSTDGENWTKCNGLPYLSYISDNNSYSNTTNNEGYVSNRMQYDGATRTYPRTWFYYINSTYYLITEVGFIFKSSDGINFSWTTTSQPKASHFQSQSYFYYIPDTNPSTVTNYSGSYAFSRVVELAYTNDIVVVTTLYDQYLVSFKSTDGENWTRMNENNLNSALLNSSQNYSYRQLRYTVIDNVIYRTCLRLTLNKNWQSTLIIHKIDSSGNINRIGNIMSLEKGQKTYVSSTNLVKKGSYIYALVKITNSFTTSNAVDEYKLIKIDGNNATLYDTSDNGYRLYNIQYYYLDKQNYYKFSLNVYNNEIILMTAGPIGVSTCYPLYTIDTSNYNISIYDNTNINIINNITNDINLNCTYKGHDISVEYLSRTVGSGSNATTYWEWNITSPDFNNFIIPYSEYSPITPSSSSYTSGLIDYGIPRSIFIKGDELIIIYSYNNAKLSNLENNYNNKHISDNAYSGIYMMIINADISNNKFNINYEYTKIITMFGIYKPTTDNTSLPYVLPLLVNNRIWVSDIVNIVKKDNLILAADRNNILYFINDKGVCYNTLKLDAINTIDMFDIYNDHFIIKITNSLFYESADGVNWSPISTINQIVDSLYGDAKVGTDGLYFLDQYNTLYTFTENTN